jgi:hypothetical protein
MSRDDQLLAAVLDLSKQVGGIERGLASLQEALPDLSSSITAVRTTVETFKLDHATEHSTLTSQLAEQDKRIGAIEAPVEEYRSIRRHARAGLVILFALGTVFTVTVQFARDGLDIVRDWLTIHTTSH